MKKCTCRKRCKNMHTGRSNLEFFQNFDYIVFYGLLKQSFSTHSFLQETHFQRTAWPKGVPKIYILSIYTIWDRLRQKTISSYCPFNSLPSLVFTYPLTIFLCKLKKIRNCNYFSPALDASYFFQNKLQEQSAASLLIRSIYSIHIKTINVP